MKYRIFQFIKIVEVFRVINDFRYSLRISLNVRFRSIINKNAPSKYIIR